MPPHRLACAVVITCGLLSSFTNVDTAAINTNTNTNIKLNNIKQQIDFVSQANPVATTDTNTITILSTSKPSSSPSSSSSSSSSLSSPSSHVEHDHDQEFQQYAIKHGKNYHLQDYPARLAAYKANNDLVRRHNEEAARGLHSYTLAMNQFADLSNEEFRSFMLGFHSSAPQGQQQQPLRDPDVPTNNNNGQASALPVRGVATNLPASVDWRSRHVVTAPKNQGGCGACWAFAAAGAIEGAHALATGSLLDLSPQVLVDCVNGGSNTCAKGGEMIQAYEWVISQNGMQEEAHYPYRMTSGNQCAFDGTHKVARVSGYVNVTRDDEGALAAAISSQPGVSIGIDAARPTFQLYSEGVYDEPNCKSKLNEINHGVLAVGYGHDDENGKEYYLIKNSWGPWWGQGGYIKMVRNKENQCGVATDASYPTLN